MASASGTPRGRRRTTAEPLSQGRAASDKMRQADARWRASIQACYTLLRPVLQSRQPTVGRASKPRILEATRQHILELERALAMLLEMKNNVIQTLFDGPPPPRLTVEQYKSLFRGLYPLDAPKTVNAFICGCPQTAAAAVPQGPAGDGLSAAAAGQAGGGTIYVSSETLRGGSDMPSGSSNLFNGSSCKLSGIALNSGRNVSNNTSRGSGVSNTGNLSRDMSSGIGLSNMRNGSKNTPMGRGDRPRDPNDTPCGCDDSSIGSIKALVASVDTPAIGCATLIGSNGTSSDSSDTPSGSDNPPTEPDLAELASLLHDAYDATDLLPALEDSNMAAPTPLQGAAMLGGPLGHADRLEAPGPVAEREGAKETVAEERGKEEERAGEVADEELLPEVGENLTLELPSLELPVGWSYCDAEETPPAPRLAWQELEMAAQSLSVPAELEQFTRIQRSDWDMDGEDMLSEPAPPESHLSPFSPEMALPAFCSTPEGGDGAGPLTATPPPGAGHAKRAGTASAAESRAADRCRRALALGGGL